LRYRDERSDAAAEALIRIGARAVKPLCARLLDTNTDGVTNRDVRRAAAEVLDRLKWKPDQSDAEGAYWVAKQDWQKCVEIGASAVAPLCTELKSYHSDDESDICRAVAEALGKIGDVRAVEPLCAKLNNNEDLNVRQAAARALVGLYFSNNQNPHVRQMILKVRETITQPHISEYSEKCNNHHDVGIGVDFPL
jgi:hypothetical protein